MTQKITLSQGRGGGGGVKKWSFACLLVELLQENFLNCFVHKIVL